MQRAQPPAFGGVGGACTPSNPPAPSADESSARPRSSMASLAKVSSSRGSARAPPNTPQPVLGLSASSEAPPACEGVRCLQRAVWLHPPPYESRLLSYGKESRSFVFSIRSSPADRLWRHPPDRSRRRRRGRTRSRSRAARGLGRRAAPRPRLRALPAHRQAPSAPRPHGTMSVRRDRGAVLWAPCAMQSR